MQTALVLEKTMRVIPCSASRERETSKIDHNDTLSPNDHTSYGGQLYSSKHHNFSCHVFFFFFYVCSSIGIPFSSLFSDYFASLLLLFSAPTPMEAFKKYNAWIYVRKIK